MKQNETEMSQKIAGEFSCDLCHYYTCNKFDYKKHCLTVKHKNRDNETK